MSIFERLKLSRRDLIKTGSALAATPAITTASRIEATANFVANLIPDQSAAQSELAIVSETEPEGFSGILSLYHTRVDAPELDILRPSHLTLSNDFQVLSLDRLQLERAKTALSPQSPLREQIDTLTQNIDSRHARPANTLSRRRLLQFPNTEEYPSDSGAYSILINEEATVAIAYQESDGTRVILDSSGKTVLIRPPTEPPLSVAPEINDSQQKSLQKYYTASGERVTIDNPAFAVSTTSDHQQATQLIYRTSADQLVSLDLTSPHINLSNRTTVISPEDQPRTRNVPSEVAVLTVTELSPRHRDALIAKAQNLLPRGNFQDVQALIDTDGSVFFEVTAPSDNPDIKQRLTYRPVWLSSTQADHRDLSGVGFTLTLPGESLSRRLPNHAPRIKAYQISPSEPEASVEQQLNHRTELPTYQLSTGFADTLRPSPEEAPIRESDNNTAILRNFPIIIDTEGNVVIEGLDTTNLSTEPAFSDDQVAQLAQDLANYIVNDTVDYPNGSVSLQFCITETNQVAIAPYFEQTVTSKVEDDLTTQTPAKTLNVISGSELFIMDTQQPGFTNANTTLHAVTQQEADVALADIPEEFRPRAGSIIAIQYAPNPTLEQEESYATILVPGWGIVSWTKPSETAPVTVTPTPNGFEQGIAVAALGPIVNLEPLYRAVPAAPELAPNQVRSVTTGEPIEIPQAGLDSYHPTDEIKPGLIINFGQSTIDKYKDQTFTGTGLVDVLPHPLAPEQVHIAHIRTKLLMVTRDTSVNHDIIMLLGVGKTMFLLAPNDQVIIDGTTYDPGSYNWQVGSLIDIEVQWQVFNRDHTPKPSTNTEAAQHLALAGKWGQRITDAESILQSQNMSIAMTP